MHRRALPLLLLCLPACLTAADPAREAAAVVTEVAASLTAGNLQMFLAPFDAALPDYDRLRAAVAALMAQGDTQSYLEVTSNEGDDRARTLTVDWELRTATARRQVRVTCKVELKNKRWRIVGFTPIDFLMP
jgi:hypothetical protein